MGLTAAAYAFILLTPTNEVFYYLGMLLCGLAPAVALAGAARPGGDPLDPVAAAFVVIGA